MKREEAADELRRRAEGRLGEACKAEGPLREEDGDRRLVHELQVHQIELEMQNEELQRARDAAEEALALYTELYDFAPVGYLTLGPDGTILRLNLAGARLLRAERTRLVGRRLGLFVAEPDRLVLAAFLGKVFGGKALEACEVSVNAGDAGPRVVSLEASTLEGGQACRAVMIDITDRRHAEWERLAVERRLLQSQKLESLGVLAGGIAHVFNNLLLVIQGNADLTLSELPLDSPLRESLLGITQASNRAAALCAHMLTYSGRGRFFMKPLDLSKLVADLVQLLNLSIPKKAKLHLNLEQGLPPMLGDLGQVSQAIMNLAINAAEAIGQEGGEITVTTGFRECSSADLSEVCPEWDLTPGTFLTLSVSDTGSGMDAATRKRIFEPFFTTRFIGRGLGLSAVLGIVHAHKGALTVESEPGRGTTFRVLFPASEAAGRVDGATEAAEEVDPLRVFTILLVDDDEAVLAVGARMLEKQEFRVLTAADGREAVEIYRQNRDEIDMVLLDLTMPRMDGVEALRELRRLNPKVRVILVSGYTEEDVASRLAEGETFGFLPKPYSSAELRGCLAVALKGLGR